MGSEQSLLRRPEMVNVAIITTDDMRRQVAVVAVNRVGDANIRDHDRAPELDPSRVALIKSKLIKFMKILNLTRFLWKRSHRKKSRSRSASTESTTSVSSIEYELRKRAESDSLAELERQRAA